MILYVLLANGNILIVLVTRQLLAKHIGSCPVDGLVHSVAVLMDRIYAVEDRTIVIYENKVPYKKLEEEIQLKQSRLYTTPCTIRACTTHSCAYIGDEDTDCIYKVDALDNNSIAAWLNVTSSFFFTVSRSGNVLVVDTSYPNAGNSISPCLRVLSSSSPSADTIRLIPLKGVSEYLFGHLSVIIEILPDVVAYTCKNVNGGRLNSVDKRVVYCLVIMRLDEEGTVLRIINWRSEIGCLVPFLSSSRLFVSEFNNCKASLFDYRQLPGDTQEILSTDGSLVDMCFVAEQRLLFALNAGRGWRIDIYRIQYDDEEIKS